ncbi:DUF6578 domain-containing protein [Saccharopolyspora shandongensis]|uniref:DUF6578 domain-containing protein n=1 Tax=Saccharopolyspora shandongensis TaxID=418495 RepID=UPI00341B8C61
MSAAEARHRLTVPVLLDGWQIECCGTPPAVGDQVSWWLEWSQWSASAIPTDMALRARLARRSVPEGFRARTTEGTVPAVAMAGGVRAFVSVPEPLPAEITLTGVLHEDHHSARSPDDRRTCGRVTAVWLVSWEYELRDRCWRPVDGTAELESVQRAPKFMPRSTPPERGGYWRDTNSVLVELETSDGPPAAS